MAGDDAKIEPLPEGLPWHLSGLFCFDIGHQSATVSPMKNGLVATLALLALPSLTAQGLLPTSVPVNKTKTSLLTKQVDQLAQHDLQANFRLFLNYSAK